MAGEPWARHIMDELSIGQQDSIAVAASSVDEFFTDLPTALQRGNYIV